jgi:uncharacterized protein (DUF1697 family)
MIDQHPMQTIIALFRGINVGGNAALPMKTLVSILERLGAEDARTYINSGNAVLRTQEIDLPVLESKIRQSVKECCGFMPHVLLLGLSDFEKAMLENPFPEGESTPKNLHLGFLGAKPINPNLAKLDSLKSESERYHLADKVFYLYAPDGFGLSRLANSSEKLLGVPMTDRNWRTVCKIWELANR